MRLLNDNGRFLRSLAAEGAIRNDRRVVEILDRARLRSLARRGRLPGARLTD